MIYCKLFKKEIYSILPECGFKTCDDCYFRELINRKDYYERKRAEKAKINRSIWKPLL